MIALRWIVALGLIFFCAFGLHESTPLSSIEKVVRTIQHVDVVSEHYVLHHGGSIRDYSQEDALNLMRSVRKEFRLSSIDTKKLTDRNMYTCFGKYQMFDIKTTLLCEESQEPPYLSIEITGKGSFHGEMLYLKRKLATLLRINKVDPRFHFTIQGTQQHCDRKPIKEALNYLKAKEVESMVEKTVSVSAYSPYLFENLKVNGSDMNVQIATRFDKEREKLMVTIGTPIITIEY